MEKITIKKRDIIIVSTIIIILILIGIFIYFNYNRGITKERVKQIIYNKTKFEKGSIDFEKIKLKDNKYNVEIIYNGIVFTFVIDSNNGKIIKNDFDDYPDKEYKGSGKFDYISKKTAKELIANELKTNIKNLDFISTKFQKGNYSAIYTIKVNYKNYLYEYTIDGISGDILPGYTKITEKK